MYLLNKEVKNNYLKERLRGLHCYLNLSEIHNLDYFLNPQKVIGKGNCNYAVESSNANVSIPKVSFNELKVRTIIRILYYSA